MATQLPLKGPSGSHHPGKVLPRQPGVCVLQWKLCKVVIPLAGDKAMARQWLEGSLGALARPSALLLLQAERNTPQSRRTLTNDFP